MGYFIENRPGFQGAFTRVTDETPAETQLGRALRARDLASIRAADAEEGRDRAEARIMADRKTIAQLRDALRWIATNPDAPAPIQKKATRALAYSGADR